MQLLMKAAVLALVPGAMAISASLGAAPPTPAAPAPKSSTAPVKQKTFESPEKAFEALVAAAESYDVTSLKEILGAEGADLVVTNDTVHDKTQAATFAAKAREKSAVVRDPKNPKKVTVNIGNQDWPVPIPIVLEGGRWRFDTRAGRQEVLYRRIGANELDAIEVCHNYVAAQVEYAMQLHDGSKIHQYAQRILSTPGKNDGLAWKNPNGTPGGPLAEGAAQAIEEGYSIEKASAYHGYYFHVLKGQGPAAPMGELNYMIKDMMIGGFALIATPAEYGVTGIQTFIISADNIVYQKDLGEDSLNIARKIERYNPDASWQPTTDSW